jgi:hypothetical protein
LKVREQLPAEMVAEQVSPVLAVRVTFPVAATPVADGVTVKLNDAACPSPEGFELLVRPMVVVPGPTV